MKRFSVLLTIFFISMPLFGQLLDPIDFIGTFPPDVKDSISNHLNFGLQHDIYLHISYNFVPSPCDTLADLDDTLSGCNWSSVPWTSHQAVINNVPGFPNCTIWAVYMERSCPSNPLIKQIDLVSFSTNSTTLGTNFGCTLLDSYLSTGTDSLKAVKLLDLENDLYQSISRYEAEQMGTFSSCDSLGNYLSQYFFYRQNSCKAKILLEVQMASAVFSFCEDIVCNGDAGCCKTTISFCKDSLGTVVQNIQHESNVMNCNSYPTELDFQDLLESYYTDPNFNNPTIFFSLLPCINSCE
ncbi:MAG: hypothetical protein IJK61_03165 [Bacteroidetes bacterium]|nr:hypothetical protein [Bacteroidota bacterium]